VRFTLKRDITGDVLFGADGLGEKNLNASSSSARLVIPS
jgi:hypothetical protein